MAKSIYSVIFMWFIFFCSVIKRIHSQKEFSFSHNSPPAIFVFGDSLSDTGNVMAAFPFMADAENSPYGSTFFHAPSGRFSDGRLIIDFMAERWGFPFLEPYFKNIVPNYRHGINFAVSGATARNLTQPVPFFLPLQTDHFVRFKRHVYSSFTSKHKIDCLESHVPPLKSFEDGLYMIFIGVNDILNSFILDGATPPRVKQKIVPLVISAISKAVQDLHKEGARNFMVFNVPAVGCTPVLLSLASEGTLINSTDGSGCLKEYNGVAAFANLELEQSMKILHQQLEDVKIVVADLYAFMLEAIANPRSYGFDEKVKFKACCGYGEPYNCNLLVPCGGNPLAKACSRPNDYMSWDGIHFTDAFSERFVEEMLKGMPYLKPAPSSTL